jgi:hypothetical protein
MGVSSCYFRNLDRPNSVRRFNRFLESTSDSSTSIERNLEICRRAIARCSTASPIRGDAGRIRKLSDPKVGLSMKVLEALRDGSPLDPRMTRQERMALSVASTQPIRHVIITTTTGVTRQELTSKYHLLVRRIERNQSRRKEPLIYVGNFAQGCGSGGCHIHILLWEEPHWRTWQTQRKELGLGEVAVTDIPPAPEAVLHRTSYVLGQHESVFGTDAHLHHRPRAKGQHGVVYPKLGTLEQYHPKLFYALELAKDKSVTDETLVKSLPIFI